MSEWLNTEQVLRLSPDASSLRNAKKLAVVQKWQALGADANALWGEIKGSGKKPYQTTIDITNGPAYKCSCSSRKQPCKHALALMLVYTQDAAAFTTPPAAPSWVTAWLSKRATSLQQKQQPKAVDPAKAAKTAEKRLADIRAGLAELHVWLSDLVRGGLAQVQTKTPDFYENPAKRLVDAKAPGLANRVRALAALPGSGDQWIPRYLGELGQLHLIIQGFERFEALPEPVQADLRTAAGWNMQPHELIDAAAVRDAWWVMGRALYEEDRLRTQRLWLFGQQTGQTALLLDFTYGPGAFDHNYTVGETVDAEVAYYPSAYPQRAVVRAQYGPADPPASAIGCERITDAVRGYGAAIARNPWLASFPMALTAVIPVKRGGDWLLVDADGASLPLNPHAVDPWMLFAISGGQPVWLFGEWDGRALSALTIYNQNGMLAL